MSKQSLHLVQSERLLEGKGVAITDYLKIALLIKCIIPALKCASTDKARGSVLTLALIAFEHDDEYVHDEEIKLGADFTICNCLRRAVAIDVDSRETDRFCRLLESIYKCSDAIATASFCRHGAILLPLLVTIASSATSSLRSKMIATRLLQRSNPDGLILSQIKDADLLLIAMVRFLRNGSADCQNNTLLALIGITMHPQSKPDVARFPGLLEAVVESAETCEGGALAVLVNLALDSRSKEAITKTRGFLQLLKNSTSSKESAIVRSACRCLLYLSSSSFVNQALVTFESGVLLDRLADLLGERCIDVKMRVLQTISNLVSESTADALGYVSNLMEQLADIGSSSPATGCSVIASKAIKRLSCYMRTRHGSHETLCDALVRMAKSPSFDVSLWTARAYIEQSLNPSNSFVMVRCESTIRGILCLAKSKHSRVRSSAVEAIANLSQEAANASRLSMHESVVQTLIESINGDHKSGASENERREAVRAILLIANHASASRRLAKHQGLIQALSRYGTSEDGDVELKQAALHGVLMLAPSM